MPTVGSRRYQFLGIFAAIALAGYAGYYVYSNSTGVLLAQARQAVTVGDATVARAALDRILVREPDHVDALLLISILDFGAGNFPQTEASLKRVLSQDSGHAEARSLLADVYLTQCRFSDAQRILEEVPTLVSSSPPSRGKLALALAGQVVGATQPDLAFSRVQPVVDEAIRSQPDMPEAKLAHAIILVQKREAQRALEEANIAKPRMRDPFITDWVVGKAAYLLGDTATAQATLDRADEHRKARRDLTPPAAWNMEMFLLRGLVLIDQGKLDEAERMLSAARENDSTSTEPTLALVNLYLLRAFQADNPTADPGEQVRFYQRAADELSRQPQLLESSPVYRYQLALIRIYVKDFKEALEHLEQLANMDPPYMQSLHELGNQYNFQASYTKAIRIYQRILTYEPSNLLASYNLGSIQIRNRDIGAAREHLQSVVDRKPEWQQARLNYALACRLGGDYGKAEESYRSILAKSADNVNALIGLGLVAMSKGDSETAEKFFVQARDAHTDRAEPYYYLGQVAFDQGRTAEAQSMFEKCLGIDPENEFAAMALVEIHLRRQTWDQARIRLEAILANPNARMRTVAENALCLLENMAGNLDEARKRLAGLKELIREVGQEIGAAIQANMAALAWAEGKTEEAAGLTRTVAELLPKSPEAYYNLGTYQLMLGRYADAVLAYERVLSLNPKHSDAQYNLAVAKASLNQWEGALQILSEIAKDPGVSVEVLGYLAEAYMGANQPDEALKTLDPAIGRFPLAANLQTMKVMALLMKSDNEAAAALSNEVVKQFPTDAISQMVRGVAAFRLGDYTESENRFRKAYQLQATDPIIQLNLATFLINQGSYSSLEEAGVLLDSVEKSGIQRIPVCNQKGLLAFRRADYPAAKEWLEASLVENANQPEIQELLRRIEDL